MDSWSITCKLPIEDEHLHLLIAKLGSSDNFDDRLFLAICFMAYLFIPKEFSRHSFQAGGATHLAAVGIPNDKIQAMGHWSSEAWRSYVRKNPVVLLANVSPSSVFDFSVPYA